MLTFHAPNGAAVYIRADQIAAVIPPAHPAGPGAVTYIVLENGVSQYVREPAETVIEMMRSEVPASKHG